jgi:hypothetical protein
MDTIAGIADYDYYYDTNQWIPFEIALSPGRDLL